MSDLTFEERNRLESEVLPAVVDDPECAALTIVILEKQLAEARMRQTELEKEVAALEERLRMAEDELRGLEHVQCAYCGTWAHVDEVTDECGKPYCVDCYESWPWECETPGCSWRCAAPDENGDVCPECGGRFVPMSEKVLPQRAQSAQRENGE